MSTELEKEEKFDRLFDNFPDKQSEGVEIKVRRGGKASQVSRIRERVLRGCVVFGVAAGACGTGGVVGWLLGQDGGEESREVFTSTPDFTSTQALPTSLPIIASNSIETPTSTVNPIQQEVLSTATREQIGAGVDILGPNKVIKDSVWPGGISESLEGFPSNEAITVADIYNGTTTQTSNPRNLEKLSAARTYAETIFAVRGTIDTNTIVFDSTSSVYLARGTEGLSFKIYKKQAPAKYTYNQIAVGDFQTGNAYVNNNSLIGGEFLYVIEVYNVNGELENTLIYRSACGNIGRQGEILPQPTAGPTQPPRPTPTRGVEQPTQPTNTQVSHTQMPPIATRIPDTQVPPTNVPPPTVTPAPTQPPQPTATGIGPTPDVPTPLPTAAPINTPIDLPPTPTPGSNPTSVF